MGGLLVAKLVKPIKALCSWTPHQAAVGHFLLSQTKTHIRATAAGILRKANATVRQEVSRLDSSDCAFHQATEFLTLLVSDGCAQVLNLACAQTRSGRRRQCLSSTSSHLATSEAMLLFHIISLRYCKRYQPYFCSDSALNVVFSGTSPGHSISFHLCDVHPLVVRGLQ
jgi:hypothetical protein